jgi:hypothetical protein
MNNNYWIILADTQLGAIHWQNSTREQDYYEAFQTQCLKAAMDKACLGILGLGDLRERASIQARNLGGLNRGLQTLAQSNKYLLGLMGNHDKTSPNWIQEMCYPSLKDLTDPKVQEEHGFDPATTLASHFLPKAELKILLKEKGDGKKLMFLHQSIKELTSNALQSYDISIPELHQMGIGVESPCEIFMGDLHNYGDIKSEHLTLAYPGSLEMTDINEGVNGLISTRLQSGPHDYRKFVIHFYPEKQTPSERWVPIEIKPRPWFRGKARSPKDVESLLGTLIEMAQRWEAPACVLLTVPKSEINKVKNETQKLDCLEMRIEEYDPFMDRAQEAAYLEHYSHSLSWSENKRKLQAMANEVLDRDSANLLQKICLSDGSNANTKSDILSAWEDWKKQMTNHNK